MSFEAMLWATTAAPVADVNEYAVLCAMGERADVDGCNSFSARANLAGRTKADAKTVQRVIQRMEERRLIALGDQTAAEYIRADRRPAVYDLLIPYSWFAAQSSFERVRKFRASKGRPALTPILRPDIAAPPEKQKRRDVGVPRPRRVDSKSTREEGDDSHGGTTSPARVVLKSATGGLQDPRTIGMTLGEEPLSAAAPDPDPPEPPADPVDEREDGPLVDKLKGIHDATGDEVRAVLGQVGREGWCKNLPAWALSEMGGIDFAERLAKTRAVPLIASVDPWQTCGCERPFRAPEPGRCRECREQAAQPEPAAEAEQPSEGHQEYLAIRQALRRPALPPIPPSQTAS